MTTQRSFAEILALLADNTTRDISPEDMRDALETLRPRHGTAYVTGAAPTTIATPGTYYPQASTVAGVRLVGFDTPGDGRLRYTGIAPVHVHIACTLTVSCSSNNQTIGARLAVGGSTFADTEVRNRLGTGGDRQSTALHGDAHLMPNDYIDLHVTNYSSGAAVTIDLMYLFALTMAM